MGDVSSEQVLINIRLYNDSHRGGGMTFRNDGYLYVTVGDQFRFETAQDISDTLEGGSLRLAVDVTDDGGGAWTCPPGSHQPRRVFDRSDEISGRYYCIPDDNPWQDPTGTRFEEYCSVGNRNPHRLARDPVTDRLWSGEVGDASREEINVIECGNNYGWPFREGLIEGPRPAPASYLGELTDPVIDFTRDEAQAIIGGYVYRGSKFPELYGHYLAGDYVTNQVWAIVLDENTMTATKLFLASFTAGNLATWGQDEDGEVFMGDVASTGPLYTLARVDDPVPDAPPLLSQTGAFADLENAVPSPAWIPYELNQPFWSDGALKYRFLAVPNDGLRNTQAEKIEFSPFGNWSYPTGTVVMKHFELPLDESDPSVTTRLETRFLVLGSDGRWYGLTYRWRPDLTDADLLIDEQTAEYTIRDTDGETRTQTWYFPSRLDCSRCHRQGSGGALGLRTHQLNGRLDDTDAASERNQLKAWNDLGLFTPVLDEASIPMLPKAPALGDVTAPLEDRARSWLDSNCAYCHRPGEANAGFDARFTTPLPVQQLSWTEVRNDLGVPGTVVLYPGDPMRSALWRRSSAVGPIAMPPLAKSLAEEPAIELLAAWIERVEPDLPRSGLRYEYYEVGGLSALPDFDALAPVSAGTVSTPDISVREHDDHFAIRFSGYLGIEAAGDYTFYTASDDGSQLFIDGELVVDNDGLHEVQELSGVVSLGAGFHEIVVTMFEKDGGQILMTSWEGPDTVGAKVPLGPGGLFLEIPTVPLNSAPILSDPGARTNPRGDVISLDVSATDADGDTLYFDATGLPPGLSIDHESGQITGTASTAGRHSVTLSASDGPAISVAEFDWAIE